MKPASPFLTAKEAAAYLHFPSVNAFYTYRSRLKAEGHPLRCYRRGGILLFTVPDLEASLETPQPATLRRIG
jgi:hypothetical protein